MALARISAGSASSLDQRHEVGPVALERGAVAQVDPFEGELLDLLLDGRVAVGQEAAAQRPRVLPEAQVDARRLHRGGGDPPRVGLQPSGGQRLAQLLGGKHPACLGGREWTSGARPVTAPSLTNGPFSSSVTESRRRLRPRPGRDGQTSHRSPRDRRRPVRSRLYLRCVPLNQLTDGAEVDAVFVIREVERRRRRDGGDYLRLQLGDRTGAVTCMVWEELEEVEELARARRARQGHRPLRRPPPLRPPDQPRRPGRAEPGSFDPGELLDGPAAGRRADGSRGARAARDDPAAPPARAAERVLGEDSERVGRTTALAPAAKYYHQAYRHGLLEHSLGVAQAVSAISATFGGIDRDVAVTGALLHDIGKLEAYSGGQPQSIELTDLGRLHGEIALGYYRIRREIEEIEGFPEELGARDRAHHPLPPRLPRARQPGGPVHARGHARAHDRQPRRPARAASTGSRRSWLPGASGRPSTARSAPAPSSPPADGVEDAHRASLRQRPTRQAA